MEAALTNNIAVDDGIERNLGHKLERLCLDSYPFTRNFVFEEHTTNSYPLKSTDINKYNSNKGFTWTITSNKH